MEHEDAARLEAIAQAFRESAPAEWQTLRVDVNSISSVTAFVARATLADGEVRSYYLDDAVEDDVLDEIETLRRRMAEKNDGRGAWFSMRIDLGPDGKYAASFDYDSRPAFDFEVSRESLLADLREFPRDEEFYPAWART